MGVSGTGGMADSTIGTDMGVSGTGTDIRVFEAGDAVVPAWKSSLLYHVIPNSTSADNPTEPNVFE